jgi:hypothetical protein
MWEDTISHRAFANGAVGRIDDYMVPDQTSYLPPSKREMHRHINSARPLNREQKKAILRSSLYKHCLARKPSFDLVMNKQIDLDFAVSMQLAFGDDVWITNFPGSIALNNKLIESYGNAVPLTPFKFSHRIRWVLDDWVLGWLYKSDSKTWTVGFLAFLISRWDGHFPSDLVAHDSDWVTKLQPKDFTLGDALFAFAYVYAACHISSEIDDLIAWLHKVEETGLSFDEFMPFFRSRITNPEIVFRAVQNDIDVNLLLSLS